MVKKKVDSRVRGLIEMGVRKNHRSMFVLVGDHGKDQVENLHKILSRTRVKARPSVLWCYKNELGFSTHRKKRIKEIKRNKTRGLHDPDRDDPFDLFISSTNIRWTYYKESEKILGQTFGMCVLQDFEAITPNLLARTIETVEGGGLVIFLMKTVKSLKQLYTMSMDVHSRFRTEAYHEVVPRFNERFILSLGDCGGCLVLDDELNILPLSSKVQCIPSSTSKLGGGEDSLAVDDDNLVIIEHARDPELEDLQTTLADTPHVGSLVGLAVTLDQAQSVMSFLDAISEKTLRSTVALTAARGRGKSAAIGMCLAGAVAYGYSNIFVTAPSPENLRTVFEFLVSGLKALKYVEHTDFDCQYESVRDAIGGKVVVRVNVFREHRQTVQYILPTESNKLSQAELLAIDEAAAIPLPVVKSLLGPYLVFMSSTVNGYEGTGRSLSLKLIQQLRVQQRNSSSVAAHSAGEGVAGSKSKKGERKVHEERWKVAAEAAAASNHSNARKLTELSLETPIRYAKGDPVEKWLNNLLCLDVVSNSTRIVQSMPAPRDCELYLVDRDALFSYHSLAEALLQRIWALYTSAHYKNTPNDLQMLSDAPAHRLFVLLGPRSSSSAQTATGGVNLPDILCIVQVAFEGKISRQSVESNISRGGTPSGDLIPWSISQQFSDNDFATLCGARIVRVATHPDVQQMGYGSRAIDLLVAYFNGDLGGGSCEYGEFGREGVSDPISSREESAADLLTETISATPKLPPLMVSLSSRPAEKLDWIGVSFGLTSSLLNFWSKREMKLCYIRQTANDLTGEHSCIMLRAFSNNMSEEGAVDCRWLVSYVQDYRRRLVSLLSYTFSDMEASLALTLVDPDRKFSTSNADVEDSVVSTSAIASYGASNLQSEELLSAQLSAHDLHRLELYARNMVDHHMILDTLPVLARLYFLGRLHAVRLSHLQLAILLAVGLQHREVDSLAKEHNLPMNQILALFNKTVRKLSMYLQGLLASSAEAELISTKKIMKLETKANQMIAEGAATMTLQEDQSLDEQEFRKLKNAALNNSKEFRKHKVDVDVSVLAEAFDRSTKRQKLAPSSVSVPVVASETSHVVSESTKESKKKKKSRMHE